MVYPESDMDPHIQEELHRERRIKLLNPNDPSIQELWTHIKTTVEQIAKPGTDIDHTTESLLISSLLYAHKDQLSGLPNRKALLIDLEAAMAVARRLNISFVALYGDGRGFKEANDELGHPTGDKIIQAIGKAMNNSARRATDIKIHGHDYLEEDNEDPDIQVARQGGDEFAAVLFGTNLKGATIVAQRMQLEISQAVSEIVPEYQARFNRPFSMTIGMAEFDPNMDQTGEDVLNRADADLTRIRQEMGQPRRS